MDITDHIWSDNTKKICWRSSWTDSCKSIGRITAESSLCYVWLLLKVDYIM